MYNLLEIGGTLKGNIGEIIYTHLNKYAHRTRFDSHYWIEKMEFEIPNHIKEFLILNWGTIDVFEFIIENEIVKNIKFYEIKTSKRLRIMPLTKNSKNFYLECIKRGFIVKSVFIWLKENWCFEVIEKDFKISNHYIYDGNPKFSKKFLPVRA
jgi:hypothetical protein